MKTFVLAAVVAVAASTNVASAIEECSLNLLLPYVLPIAGNPAFQPCQKETGYTFVPFSGLPTPEQEAAMCNNKNCKILLQAVVDAKLPACTVQYNGQPQNIQDIIDTYSKKCLPRAF
ncbi:hypothetical protein P43SY_004421 [Pythium insidiosum]|uniref:Elicitin n=1 Tax=Pythium insidiosum TaxID=114742 RepID=A0AAD5QA54_PYTIN|nr:hypothetical protein P43SY_004421 [Pythium insidiosum]KAJ0411853.1 hypothetical protein ATCC90586_003006 [Pythium insidiosum]